MTLVAVSTPPTPTIKDPCFECTATKDRLESAPGSAATARASGSGGSLPPPAPSIFRTE
uniref:Uncharacterized protein n=1 Tax=Arundo donax TaxID=35708 RepID=A0A0A9B0F8_ARUDO